MITIPIFFSDLSLQFAGMRKLSSQSCECTALFQSCGLAATGQQATAILFITNSGIEIATVNVGLRTTDRYRIVCEYCQPITDATVTFRRNSIVQDKFKIFHHGSAPNDPRIL